MRILVSLRTENMHAGCQSGRRFPLYAISILLMMSASIACLAQSPVFQSNSPIDFGGSAAGGTTPLAVERNLMIGNTGTATLTVLSINQNGGEFFIPISRYPQLPIDINPGTSVPIPVDFEARASGPRTGSMDITDNASGSPHQVQFTGMGITNDFAYGLLTSPPSVTVTAGQRADFNVELVAGSEFSGTATLAAQGLPQGATFVAPATSPFRMFSSTVLEFAVSVSTSAPATMGRKSTHSGLKYGMLATLIGIALLSFWHFSPRTVSWPIGVLVLLASIVSCGGGGSPGGSSQGTPAGTYHLSLTATINQVTHSIPITLVVK